MVNAPLSLRGLAAAALESVGNLMLPQAGLWHNRQSGQGERFGMDRLGEVGSEDDLRADVRGAADKIARVGLVIRGPRASLAPLLEAADARPLADGRLIDGPQCRAARDLIGLSQADLGFAAGMSKRSILNFENNRGSPVKDSTNLRIRAELERLGALFLECGEGRGVALEGDQPPSKRLGVVPKRGTKLPIRT